MRAHRKNALFLIAAAALVVASNGCRLPFSARPPQQPAFGPGGSDYTHAAVGAMRLGEGGEEVWLFWPEEPTPSKAPLVVFMHGWGAISPKPYAGWIAHLVRKGNIVAYPRYQESIYTPFDEMEPNAIAGLRMAWKAAAGQTPVRPETDKVAWVSHSLGGILTVNLASASVDIGLPPPGAVMIVQPGGDERIALVNEPDLPESTRAVVVTGDADHWVGSAPAARIVDALQKVLPTDHISYVTVPSDWHSFPPLIANHFAPLAQSPLLDSALDGIAENGTKQVDFSAATADAATPETDALDYYGYWKLADGLIDEVFRGTHGDFAFGDTAAQRFMGVDSDGDPVRQLIVHELSASTP